MNRCADYPCDNYEKGSRTGARCRAGRCEIPTPGGRPDFPFWIVVHVPDTSIFAPGMTFVLFSDKQGEPAFKKPVTPGISTRCSTLQLPPCLEVGGLSAVSGEYKVTQRASIEVGYPLEEGTAIPVRVVYEPKGNDQREAFEQTLPLDALFDSSRMVSEGSKSVPQHLRALPFGTYLRIMYPLPPFDAYFPPTADLQPIKTPNHVDKFFLGDPPPTGKPLDDVTGDSRVATITREDGLDGWRVWLEDRRTKRRISVIRTLSGKEDTVRLDTTGENRAPNGAVGLGDDVEAIVAPPESWTAVPRFVTLLFGGAGLKNLRYPAIPPPVTVTGVVALPSDGSTLLGIPARLTFESDVLATRGEPDPLLQYSTTVNTDDRGRFATILPPGTYAATIEPADGTGYAKTRHEVVIDRTVTALTLQPPPRTVVRGRVVLTDERSLGEAEIVAIPEEPQDANSVKPRPGRTRTSDDGRFLFELDPGPYVFTVIPKAGTGFPRVITRPEIPSQATELPEIRVPAPTRLSFVLRDPSPTGNPIVRAVVRIFAAVPGREATPIEIGSAMTDPDGLVEILLAQEPR